MLWRVADWRAERSKAVLIDQERLDVGRGWRSVVACAEIRRAVLPRIPVLSPRSGRDNGTVTARVWRAGVLGEGRRGKTGGMGVRIVMPLRVLLPCLALCLAAAGAAAIGVAGASAAGGFVMRQADDAVRACASSMLSHGLVAVPGSSLVPGPAGPGTCGMELVSASGQVLIPAASAAGGPAIPASGSWLAAHLAGPVTVPGAGGGGRWRVVITAVHYQAQRMLFVYGPDDMRYVISGRTGRGSSGMLIVMAGLAGTGQVAAGCAAAAGTVLVLLAAAAVALTRAILRPLRAAAGLTANAGQGAGGRLEEVLARVGMPANGPHRRYGMMLASVRERLQASRAAEAAARRSAANMSGHLAETCLQLRRPVSIVHGFTGYLRQQDKPQPASLDRMLHRVTDEITRMETLAEGLHMRSAGESTGPDRQPGPPATGPAARARPHDNRQPSA